MWNSGGLWRQGVDTDNHSVLPRAPCPQLRSSRRALTVPPQFLASLPFLSISPADRETCPLPLTAHCTVFCSSSPSKAASPTLALPVFLRTWAHAQPPEKPKAQPDHTPNFPKDQ
ncbi:hypothetical protein Q8A67_020734 [Cirrhinus molitorella]|uniref:Uncharacterized protein n=1 Tax=Cirrhinus molitorella TaxID=172907 RepID=A0AA88P5R4_9TELE|nr:hypothetical protein Q8A67_020734 [Cirrhinus molitorella]